MCQLILRKVFWLRIKHASNCLSWQGEAENVAPGLLSLIALAALASQKQTLERETGSES